MILENQQDRIEQCIYINQKGQIVSESILDKEYPDINMGLLFSIIEDHIVPGNDGEVIEWQKVFSEYNETEKKQ